MAASPASVPVTLALEGGGSFGAFGWGVIGRLLEEPRLRVEAVSGASAGAMNAAMLVQGLAIGGPEEAKRLLELFWRRVAVAAGSLDLDSARWTRLFTGFLAVALDELRHKVLSHHPITPPGPNPLRTVLAGLLDASAFAAAGAPMLVVSATNVRTGEPRLFANTEVTADALLASACLPQLFPAVEIDGEAYWDGGYSSNPPLRPLIEAGAPSDVIVVRSTPAERPDVPATAGHVVERAIEIAFGAALRHEIRSIAGAQQLLSTVPRLTGVLARLRRARLHMIGAEEAFRAMRTSSHLHPSWGFLLEMRALGAATAEAWLSQNLASVGSRSTVELNTRAAIRPPEAPAG
ncbi:MAG: patatin-like phospholipase family protein [Acidisphaera sp.]|nr:patatin-like phospholipase family protein [Acidisphaera sp.]